MPNNHSERAKLAEELFRLSKKIKSLQRQYEEKEKKLIKQLEERNLKTESYSSGFKATVVYSKYPILNMEKYSQVLNIELELLEKAKKEATEYNERTPYLKVS